MKKHQTKSKKGKRDYVRGTSVAFAALILSIAASSRPGHADAATIASSSSTLGISSSTQSFCENGSYGYNVYTASSTFLKNTPVTFCLQDDTRSPLFIGSTLKPWKIIDSKGNLVYQPSSTSTGSMPPATWTYYANWDQRDNDGHLVKPGLYTVVFDYPNSPSASFTIIKAHHLLAVTK